MLREGEVRIISVTPVARGLVRPLLLALVAAALVVGGAQHVSLIHQHKWPLALVFVGPFALVALTRAWRWRSHKVHVTNERLVLEGGVLRHYRSSIELSDVIATRVDQRVTERLSRRGLVVLETSAGPMVVGKVRHPGALCRLIDAERSGHAGYPLPLDTVFTFEEPDALGLEVRPQRRRLGPRHE